MLNDNMPKKHKKSKSALGTSVKVKQGRNSSRIPKKTASRAFNRVALPVLISLLLLAGSVFLGLSGYRTATASSFFGVRSIEISGNDRTSADDIRRIVVSETEKPGVWNADLADIRTKIEKFPFVKAAAVSRVLPAGIRVNVIERLPAAVIHVKAGDFLVDGEGAVLSGVTAGDTTYPFAIHGWAESKSEKAFNDNAARLKLYKKMIEEWRQFDLMASVKLVDLTDLREPKAVIEDSGRPISVALAKDDLGKSLKRAIEAVANKGIKVRSVNSMGVYPVIEYVDLDETHR